MSTKQIPTGANGGAWTETNTAGVVVHKQFTTPTQAPQFSPPTATPIYAMGHRVGKVANGVFVKHVKGSKHFLRRPRAIALDVQSLADAEQAGATEVHVHEDESGIVYRAKIVDLRVYGFEVSRGYGPQIALRLARWTTGTPSVTQLELFGGER